MDNLQAFINTHSITSTATPGCVDSDVRRAEDEWARTAYAWTIDLAYQGRHMVIAYWCGSAHAKMVKGKQVPTPPTTADVLSSLVSDASAADAGGFEEWCADLGYDPDSRKAFAIWETCLAIHKRLIALLGSLAMLRDLAEAAAEY